MSPSTGPSMPAHTGGHGIEVRGLAKSYGNLEALAPTDLDVAPGQVVTLLGPSGCGKTTLLRMIAGLEPSSAGTVTIDGGTPDEARARKRIALIPQSPALLPWRTVEANARLLQDINPSGRSSTEPLPDPVELLDRVGLKKFRNAYPHELSGGMQQRVALVRAFALGAPYLLLDEPFAALDEITRADMRHLLASLCEPINAAVVFVTHSIAEAVYLSDRVVVLSSRPGRVVDVADITLARPRVPALEDEVDFFESVTRLRRSLLSGSEQGDRP